MAPTIGDGRLLFLDRKMPVCAQPALAAVDGFYVEVFIQTGAHGELLHGGVSVHTGFFAAGYADEYFFLELVVQYIVHVQGYALGELENIVVGKAAADLEGKPGGEFLYHCVVAHLVTLGHEIQPERKEDVEVAGDDSPAGKLERCAWVEALFPADKMQEARLYRDVSVYSGAGGGAGGGSKCGG